MITQWVTDNKQANQASLFAKLINKDIISMNNVPKKLINGDISRTPHRHVNLLLSNVIFVGWKLHSRLQPIHCNAGGPKINLLGITPVNCSRSRPSRYTVGLQMHRSGGDNVPKSLGGIGPSGGGAKWGLRRVQHSRFVMYDKPDNFLGKFPTKIEMVKQAPHSDHPTAQGTCCRKMLFTQHCSPRARSFCGRSTFWYDVRFRSYGASNLPNFSHFCLFFPYKTPVKY